MQGHPKIVLKRSFKKKTRSYFGNLLVLFGGENEYSIGRN